jgi:hypothetical protein
MMRKFLDYLGTALGFVGVVLVIGSIVVWQVGPEMMSWLYERTKPVLPFFLAGVALIIVACVISPTMRGSNRETSASDALPSREPAGDVPCGKCEALNDSQAKFCDQCGAALGASRGPP